jgi:L-iditol 2-dehydrogenase
MSAVENRKTMQALVLEENGKVVHTTVPFPENTFGDAGVLLKIRASGFCNSDIHRGFGGGAYHYPLIMGHEFAGEIVDTGVVPSSGPGEAGSPGKTPAGYKIGDRVTVFPLLPCRKCIPCQTGEYAQCTSYDYFGSRRDGAFAEYLWVPEDNLIPLPASVDFRCGAMTEPAAVALHGVRRLTVQPGYTGVVFGGGPIGNMVAQFLRFSGCTRVIVVDIDEKKLDTAAAMGFTRVNPNGGDPVRQITDITGGYGSDCTVEAVGLPETFLQAVQCTGRFGQVVFLGNIIGEFRIGEKDFSNILRKEITIRGTWNSKVLPKGKDDWSAVLEYMNGPANLRLELDPLISHTPRLQEGPEVFRKLLEKEEYISKIIFTFD